MFKWCYSCNRYSSITRIILFFFFLYRGFNMQEFEIIEKVGVSNENYSDAVKNALQRIEKKIFWFEVIEQRGRLNKDNKIEFQVVLKIGCN